MARFHCIIVLVTLKTESKSASHSNNSGTFSKGFKT